MSRIPLRRRYWDSLLGRLRNPRRAGQPYALYRPTENSPLWRRYLVSLLGVPRATRPATRPRDRDATRRLPLTLALAAVAAAVVLGASTFAALRMGASHEYSGGPITSTRQTEGDDGGVVSGGTGSTEGPASTDSVIDIGGVTPPSDSGGEPSRTGAPPILLLTTLGIGVLVLGAVSRHRLARSRTRPRTRRHG